MGIIGSWTPFAGSRSVLRCGGECGKTLSHTAGFFRSRNLFRNSQALEGIPTALTAGGSLILRKEGLGPGDFRACEGRRNSGAAVVPLSVTANLEKGLRIVAAVQGGKEWDLCHAGVF